MSSQNLTKLVDDVVASLQAARKAVSTEMRNDRRVVDMHLDIAEKGIKAIGVYGKLLVEPERVVTETQPLREVDIAGTQTELDPTIYETEEDRKRVGFRP